MKKEYGVRNYSTFINPVNKYLFIAYRMLPGTALNHLVAKVKKRWKQEKKQFLPSWTFQSRDVQLHLVVSALLYIDLCQSLPRYFVWFSGLLLYSLFLRAMVLSLKYLSNCLKMESPFIQALRRAASSILLGKVANITFLDLKEISWAWNLDRNKHRYVSELVLLPIIGNPTSPVLL